MSAGRRPKPVHEKIATGNPGKRVLPTLDECIKGRELSRNAPEWLELSDKAQVIWNKVTSDMPIGLFQGLDEPGFARYCTLYSYFQSATSMLNIDMGLIVETESRHVTMKRASPLIQLAIRLNTALTGFESLYGMTPADRQRLQIANSKAGGDQEDLLARAGAVDNSYAENISLGKLNPERIKALN